MVLFGLISSYFIYPVHILLRYIKFFLGVLFFFFPGLWTFITDRKKLFQLHTSFQLLKNLPFGKEVFTGVVACLNPYCSSISPRFEKLEITNNIAIAEVSMSQYYWLTNPYNSIHACALAGLGELSSGICIFSSLQLNQNLHGIPIKIEMEYYKKARGIITAKTQIDLSILQPNKIIKFESDIVNQQNEVVAKCVVIWNMKEIQKKQKEQ